MPKTINTTERRYRALLDQHRRSRLSLAEFARQNDVNPSTLAWWKCEIRRREASRQSHTASHDAGVPVFLPVQFRAEEPAPKSHDRFPFEVDLGGALRVRIAAGFDPADLQRLLEVLGAPAC